MTNMRFIDVKQPGSAEQLYLAETSKPHPGAGDVLIRVAAFGVNRPDVLQRLGAYPPPPDASPILGLEAAGEIVAVGQGVSQWQVGDLVCGLSNGGAYAEYVVIPANQCLPIPTGLSLQEAASLPETFFTVWSNVFMTGQLKSGDVFLVHGGSSGIGVTAIQLAKAFGATVITTAGSDEKCRACEALGADLAINYRRDNFVDECKRFLGKQRVDVILDMVGGDYIQANIDIAARDGRIINIAFLEGACATVNFTMVMIKRLLITGSTLRPRSPEEKALIAEQLKHNVWPKIDNGHIKPVIAKIYPWHAIVEAHQYMESSQHIGKIVMQVD